MMALLSRIIPQRNRLGTKLMKFFNVRAGVDRLIWFVLTFFVIVHLVACGFGLVGLEEPEPSWITAYDLRDNKHWDLYIVCFHWTITTLTTVGYGDISPQNNVERLYSNFVMIAGIFIYSYIIGAVAGLISNLDAEQNSLDKKYAVLS